MSLLTSQEAVDASDAFLCTLYGSEIFCRWQSWKCAMKFIAEKDYVSWLLDIADHYWEMCDGEDGEAQTVTRPVAATGGLFSKRQDNDQNVTQQDEENPYKSFFEFTQQQDEGKVTIDDRTPAAFSHVRVASVEVPQLPSNTETTPEKCGYESELESIKDENTISNGKSMEQASTSKQSDYTSPAIDKQDWAAIDCNIIEVVGESSKTSNKWKPGDKRYRCSLCSFVGKRKDGLRRHLKTVHDTAKAFACKTCRFRTSTRYLLRQHEINKHHMPTLYVCAQCDRPFPNASKLRVHAETCDGCSKAGKSQDTVKTYLCELCTFSTNHKSSLFSHNKFRHSDDRTFSCPHCHYTCPMKGNLQTHLICKHKYKSKFHCDRCERYFPSYAKLKDHKSRPKCSSSQFSGDIAENSSDVLKAEDLNISA